MFTDLLHSSYFSLFLIVALGFMLGRIKIKGLSLDVSAVIFIALLFGHFGVIIPKELGNFGLVLFIFTIGIQAGPGFFDSFRSKGKTLILITMLIICSACLTAVGLKYAFDIDTPSVVGLIAGALTSTPGLAVAIDSTNSPLASIAYGIAYPFGVIGVILFVKLLPKIMRVDLDKEARRLEIERRGQFPELTTCIYRVTNANVFDRSLMQINARGMTGAVISRLKHDDEISIPTAHTVLHEGDYIQAVGSEESLDQLAVLVGKREEGELPLDKTQEIESLLLTKKDMINKQLGDLNLQKNFGCTVTRVRRSGIDLSPSPDLALKFGDKLMVVGEKEGLKGVARLLGNNAKKLSDTDFFPIAMGKKSVSDSFFALFPNRRATPLSPSFSPTTISLSPNFKARSGDGDKSIPLRRTRVTVQPKFFCKFKSPSCLFIMSFLVNNKDSISCVLSKGSSPSSLLPTNTAS